MANVTMIPTLPQYATAHGVDVETLDDERMTVLWHKYADEVFQQVQHDKSLADDEEVWTDAVSVDLLTSIMGAAWVQDRIINFRSCDLSKDYLDLGEHVSQVAMRRHRIRELARRMYELQSFDWFRLVRENLRTRDIGPVAFEMDALWLLMLVSPSVGTSAEVSERGKDFDAYALMRDTMVPVEVKTKSDRTAWTLDTVKNSVRSAARQLPKGKVGLLVIRIPYAWVGHQLEEFFADALSEGTRQTTRIGAVIAVIDKPTLSTGLPVSRFLTYFREQECPEHIWEFCMILKEFWEKQLYHMAPVAPF